MSEPRTADQWLNVELHDAGPDYDGGPQFTCIKCKQTYSSHERSRCPASDLCVELAKAFLVPDRIKVDDWNTVKYWQGKCDKDKWYAMLEELYYAIPDDICSCPWEWALFYAQPKHLLIIAAMVLERNKE